MGQIKNIYLGNLRTELEHLKSGQKLITDAPTDNKGKGEAFSPTDTVCAALSSCILTTMAIRTENENIDLTGTVTDVTKIMTSQPPRKIAEIHVDIHIPERLQLSDRQKELLKHIAHTCPVSLSLHPDIVQKLNFNF